jgi:hypothetical protein
MATTHTISQTNASQWFRTDGISTAATLIDGDTIKVTENITLPATNNLYLYLPKNITFDGEGFTINLNGKQTSGIFKVTNNSSTDATSIDDAPIIQNVFVTNGEILNGGGILQNSSKYAKLINCVTYNFLTASAFTGRNCGGIVGKEAGIDGNVHIDKCYSTINFHSNYAKYSGGIVGSHCGVCTITNCYYSGYIDQYSQGGGIVGYWPGRNGVVTIQNCYTTQCLLTGSYTGPSLTQSNCFSPQNIGLYYSNVKAENDVANLKDLNSETEEYLKLNSGYQFKLDTINDATDSSPTYPLINSLITTNYNKAPTGIVQCNDANYKEYNNASTTNVDCATIQIIGCTDPSYLEYNADATTTDLTMCITKEPVHITQANVSEMFTSNGKMIIDGSEVTENFLEYREIILDEDITLTTSNVYITLPKGCIFNGNDKIIRHGENIVTKGLFKVSYASVDDGTPFVDKDIVEIKYLHVRGGSLGSPYAGYITQSYVGNVIVHNCSSNGEINQTGCGGIAGGWLATSKKVFCEIRNCVTFGNITGTDCGGIIGGYIYSSVSGYNTVHIHNCVVHGEHSSQSGGGIAGSSFGRSNSGDNNANASFLIENCYTVGNHSIPFGSGGTIVGAYVAADYGKCTIQNCYSVGVNNNTGSTNELYVTGDNATLSGYGEYTYGKLIITNVYAVEVNTQPSPFNDFPNNNYQFPATNLLSDLNNNLHNLPTVSFIFIGTPDDSTNKYPILKSLNEETGNFLTSNYVSYLSMLKNGCNDPDALNYNREVTVATTCSYTHVSGCTNSAALNYDEAATMNNGTCIVIDETNTLYINATNITKFFTADGSIDIGTPYYLPENVTVKLSEDVTISHITSGTSSTRYLLIPKNGIFDGQGYTLTLGTDVTTEGLFRTKGTSLSDCGIIKNLGIIGGQTANNGGFFVKLGGIYEDLAYTKIENCFSTGEMNGQDSGGILSIGVYDGQQIIKNCYSTGSIKGPGSGGICGKLAGTGPNGYCLIQNCYSAGNHGRESYQYFMIKNMGGIVGWYAGSNSGKCIIQNCYALFDPESNLATNCGGIAGQYAGSNSGRCIIQNSFSVNIADKYPTQQISWTDYPRPNKFGFTSPNDYLESDGSSPLDGNYNISLLELGNTLTGDAEKINSLSEITMSTEIFRNTANKFIQDTTEPNLYPLLKIFTNTDYNVIPSYPRINDVIYGCDDVGAINYDPSVTSNDGSCEYLGCTNPDAENYNSLATQDDPENPCIVLGCMNSLAENYNSEATQNDPENPCIVYNKEYFLNKIYKTASQENEIKAQYALGSARVVKYYHKKTIGNVTETIEFDFSDRNIIIDNSVIEDGIKKREAITFPLFDNNEYEIFNDTQIDYCLLEFTNNTNPTIKYRYYQYIPRTLLENLYNKKISDVRTTYTISDIIPDIEVNNRYQEGQYGIPIIRKLVEENNFEYYDLFIYQNTINIETSQNDAFDETYELSNVYKDTLILVKEQMMSHEVSTYMLNELTYDEIEYEGTIFSGKYMIIDETETAKKGNIYITYKTGNSLLVLLFNDADPEELEELRFVWNPSKNLYTLDTDPLIAGNIGKDYELRIQIINNGVEQNGQNGVLVTETVGENPYLIKYFDIEVTLLNKKKYDETQNTEKSLYHIFYNLNGPVALNQLVYKVSYSESTGETIKIQNGAENFISLEGAPSTITWYYYLNLRFNGGLTLVNQPFNIDYLSNNQRVIESEGIIDKGFLLDPILTLEDYETGTHSNIYLQDVEYELYILENENYVKVLKVQFNNGNITSEISGDSITLSDSLNVLILDNLYNKLIDLSDIPVQRNQFNIIYSNSTTESKWIRDIDGDTFSIIIVLNKNTIEAIQNTLSAYEYTLSTPQISAIDALQDVITIEIIIDSDEDVQFITNISNYSGETKYNKLPAEAPETEKQVAYDKNNVILYNKHSINSNKVNEVIYTNKKTYKTPKLSVNSLYHTIIEFGKTYEVILVSDLTTICEFTLNESTLNYKGTSTPSGTSIFNLVYNKTQSDLDEIAEDDPTKASIEKLLVSTTNVVASETKWISSASELTIYINGTYPSTDVNYQKPIGFIVSITNDGVIIYKNSDNIDEVLNDETIFPEYNFGLSSISIREKNNPANKPSVLTEAKTLIEFNNVTSTQNFTMELLDVENNFTFVTDNNDMNDILDTQIYSILDDEGNPTDIKTIRNILTTYISEEILIYTWLDTSTIYEKILTYKTLDETYKTKLIDKYGDKTKIEIVLTKNENTHYYHINIKLTQNLSGDIENPDINENSDYMKKYGTINDVDGNSVYILELCDVIIPPFILEKNFTEIDFESNGDLIKFNYNIMDTIISLDETEFTNIVRESFKLGKTINDVDAYNTVIDDLISDLNVEVDESKLDASMSRTYTTLNLIDIFVKYVNNSLNASYVNDTDFLTLTVPKNTSETFIIYSDSNTNTTIKLEISYIDTIKSNSESLYYYFTKITNSIEEPIGIVYGSSNASTIPFIYLTRLHNNGIIQTIKDTNDNYDNNFTFLLPSYVKNLVNCLVKIKNVTLPSYDALPSKGFIINGRLETDPLLNLSLQDYYPLHIYKFENTLFNAGETNEEAYKLDSIDIESSPRPMRFYYSRELYESIKKSTAYETYTRMDLKTINLSMLEEYNTFLNVSKGYYNLYLEPIYIEFSKQTAYLVKGRQKWWSDEYDPYSTDVRYGYYYPCYKYPEPETKVIGNVQEESLIDKSERPEYILIGLKNTINGAQTSELKMYVNKNIQGRYNILNETQVNNLRNDNIVILNGNETFEIYNLDSGLMIYDYPFRGSIPRSVTGRLLSSTDPTQTNYTNVQQYRNLVTQSNYDTYASSYNIDVYEYVFREYDSTTNSYNDVKYYRPVNVDENITYSIQSSLIVTDKDDNTDRVGGIVHIKQSSTDVLAEKFCIKGIALEDSTYSYKYYYPLYRVDDGTKSFTKCTFIDGNGYIYGPYYTENGSGFTTITEIESNTDFINLNYVEKDVSSTDNIIETLKINILAKPYYAHNKDIISGDSGLYYPLYKSNDLNTTLSIHGLANIWGKSHNFIERKFVAKDGNITKAYTITNNMVFNEEYNITPTISENFNEYAELNLGNHSVEIKNIEVITADNYENFGLLNTTISNYLSDNNSRIINIDLKDTIPTFNNGILKSMVKVLNNIKSTSEKETIFIADFLEESLGDKQTIATSVKFNSEDDTELHNTIERTTTNNKFNEILYVIPELLDNVFVINLGAETSVSMKEMYFSVLDEYKGREVVIPIFIKDTDSYMFAKITFGDIVLPLEVERKAYYNNGLNYPVFELTSDEYNNFPNKYLLNSEIVATINGDVEYYTYSKYTNNDNKYEIENNSTNRLLDVAIDESSNMTIKNLKTDIEIIKETSPQMNITELIFNNLSIISESKNLYWNGKPQTFSKQDVEVTVTIDGYETTQNLITYHDFYNYYILLGSILIGPISNIEEGQTVTKNQETVNIYKLTNPGDIKLNRKYEIENIAKRQVTDTISMTLNVLFIPGKLPFITQTPYQILGSAVSATGSYNIGLFYPVYELEEPGVSEAYTFTYRTTEGVSTSKTLYMPKNNYKYKNNYSVISYNTDLEFYPGSYNVQTYYAYGYNKTTSQIGYYYPLYDPSDFEIDENYELLELVNEYDEIVNFIVKKTEVTIAGTEKPLDPILQIHPQFKDRQIYSYYGLGENLDDNETSLKVGYFYPLMDDNTGYESITKEIKLKKLSEDGTAIEDFTMYYLIDKPNKNETATYIKPFVQNTIHPNSIYIPTYNGDYELSILNKMSRILYQPKKVIYNYFSNERMNYYLQKYVYNLSLPEVEQIEYEFVLRPLVYNMINTPRFYKNKLANLMLNMYGVMLETTESTIRLNIEDTYIKTLLDKVNTSRGDTYFNTNVLTLILHSDDVDLEELTINYTDLGNNPLYNLVFSFNKTQQSLYVNKNEIEVNYDNDLNQINVRYLEYDA